MGDDLPPYKRLMESPPDRPPPCKQKSWESAFLPSTTNEQNSSAIEHGLEDTSDSSEKKGESEDCGNDEKDETEINEKNHEVNKIQPEKKNSNVEPVPIPPPGPIQFTSVQSNSVSLVWEPPEGWTGCQNFKVTWESGGLLDSRDVTSSKACISDLSPGEKYEFKVVTLGEDNQQSECVSATTNTEIPAPEELKVKKDEGPVVVTWRKPEGLDQVEYVLSLWKEGSEGGEEECFHTMTATSEECLLPDVELNKKYIIKVSIVLKNGYQGKAATRHICKVPAPEQLKVASVTPTSINLTWIPPHGMDQTPGSYQVSYYSRETEPQTFSTDSCSAEIRDLKPCTDYRISLRTKLKDGEMSERVKEEVCTAVPGPGQLTVVAVTPKSVHLTWSPPRRMSQTPVSYLVSYLNGRSESKPFPTHSYSVIIEHLEPCTDYVFSICTKLEDGRLSEPVKKTVHTAVSIPEQFIEDSVTPTSINLTWSPPYGMDQTPHSYQISYHSGGTDPQIISTDSCSANITGLKPYTNYSVSVCTKLKDGGMSEPVNKKVCTAVSIPEQLIVTSVTATSAKLTWCPPHGMHQTPYYQISYHSGGPESEPTSTDACSADITGLKPYTNYSVSICTKLKDGGMSEPVNKKVRTAVSIPEQLIVASVTAKSARLTWSPPHGMDQTPYYQISYHSEGPESEPISTDSCSADITGLKPYTNYSVSVCTRLKDGGMSEPVKKKFRTAVPAPEQLIVSSVTPTSINLTWSPPHGIEQTPESYQISYHKGEPESKPFSTHSCSAIIEHLEACTQYMVSVCAKFKDGGLSEPVKKTVHTVVPAPKQLTVVAVTPTSLHLTWSPPHGIDQTPHSYQISYHSGRTEPKTISTQSCSTDITGLKPCTNYSVSVCTKVTDGEISEAVRTEVRTAVPAPEQLAVVSVTQTSIKITWLPPHGMDQTSHSYQISYHSEGTTPQIISTDSCTADITDLKPCTDYNVNVCTKVTDDKISEAVKTEVRTGESSCDKKKGQDFSIIQLASSCTLVSNCLIFSSLMKPFEKNILQNPGNDSYVV